MSTESTMHFYFNWAKERIDEMDAALASIEAKAPQVKADAKVKAEQLIADLKKRRDKFQALATKQAKEGETAWKRAQTQLQTQWNGFEAQLKAYVKTVGKQVEQQQAIFRDIAAAQAKAWREAADKLRDEGAKVAAAKRPEIDAALKQMKADADAQLKKVKEAGDQSWSVISAALAQSRKAFDRANKAGWEALKRSPQTPKS
jgi:hypothetical protein